MRSMNLVGVFVKSVGFAGEHGTWVRGCERKALLLAALKF